MANQSATLPVLPGTRYSSTYTRYRHYPSNTLDTSGGLIHSHSLFERRRAPWRRCGSRFPGVVDQMQCSIGNGLGYTKRSPAAVSLLFKLHYYLYYLNLYSSILYLISLPTPRCPLTSFLHLIFIDLVSAQFNTACPSRLHQPIRPSHLAADLVNCQLPSLALPAATLPQPISTTMPHKVTNDSNSTLASGDSSTGDQVIATEVRGMSIQHQFILAAPVHPISRFSPANADTYPGQPPIPSANHPLSSIIKAAKSTMRPGRRTGTNSAGSNILAAPILGGGRVMWI